MSGEDPTGTDWTETEVNLIVADYFDMLAMELAGKPYVKAQRNAALQEITKRSKGSIEFKHQNISAVLQELGMPWIAGYKPRSNYQEALLDGIERFLLARGDLLMPMTEPAHGLAEARPLFLEPPPQLTVQHATTSPALARLVRKFDPAARDARNRTLGIQGEERILHFERKSLTDAGRADLARKVRWVSQEDGDGAGYDILSFNHSGAERLLEVKTTVGHQTTPFYLTENERALSVERPDAFRLTRLYDFARTPKVFELTPPLEESVVLRAINYRASFGD